MLYNLFKIDYLILILIKLKNNKSITILIVKLN